MANSHLNMALAAAEGDCLDQAGRLRDDVYARDPLSQRTLAAMLTHLSHATQLAMALDTMQRQGSQQHAASLAHQRRYGLTEATSGALAVPPEPGWRPDREKAG